MNDCKRPTGFYKLAYPNSGFPQRQKPVLGTLGGDQRDWLGTGKVARNLIPVCVQIKLGALRTSGKLMSELMGSRVRGLFCFLPLSSKPVSGDVRLCHSDWTARLSAHRRTALHQFMYLS